ncbi:unnamed protein product, partial [Closterium sp. NIES-54]
MDSRREWPPSRRMRSLERGRLPTRLPCRAAYSADRVTPVGVRRDGGGPDPHIRLEPRSQALNSDPWDLARGQRGMEERCCDDDMLDSSDSAKEANGEDEADDIPIAWDDEREGVVEDERDEGSKNAGASGSLGGMRRGSVRRGESADAGHAVDEMGLRQRKVPQKRRCRSRGGQNGWRQGKAPRKRCGRSLAKGDARRRRGNTESLLTYYGRLMNLAEDVVCTDGSMLISKFMGGLDEGLSGGLRMRVYELGADATLEEVFELAEKVESAQRRNEVYLPRVAERKRATWAVAMTHGDEGREEQRQEGRPDTRTCHRCGQKGHIRINCRNYDVCGKHGHRRSDCPEKSVEEIENQLGRLRAQLQALKGKEETGWYTREEEEEEEKQEPECSYAVLRVREDMRLR